MYTTYTLTIASIKMLARNRQAFFFSLFMPLMILFIFGSINFDSRSKMSIGLVTHHPSPATALFVAGLRSAGTLTIDEGTLEDEQKELASGNRVAVLDVPDDLIPTDGSGPRDLPVYVNGSRPVDVQAATTILNQISDHAALAAANAPKLFNIQKQVTTRNTRYVDFLLPGVMAMSIMQMSVFSVAFVFTRYKEQGILKRLLATPMKSSQFVSANIITRLMMAVVQAGLFVALGVGHFHVHVVGSFWLLAACVVMGALMFLGLGFTISGIAKTIETVPVLANILVFPQLFVGNVFFSSAGMPAWLRAISNYLPLTYFSNAMRGVMVDGAGPAAIQHELVGMAVWAVILITLATLTFRLQEPDPT